jgi:ATP-binding cassette, subfamily B, bacterial
MAANTQEQILPKTNRGSSLLRLLALLKPKHWKYMAGLSGRVILATTERLAIAYFAIQTVNAITAPDMPAFQRMLLVWFLFYLGYLVIAPFVLYVWRSAIYEGTANIRETVFRHLQRLPLGYHEGHHSGEALSILTNDISAAEKAYQEDLLMLFEASVMGIAAAVFMLLINWQLSLLVIASSLMPLVINALFAGPLRKVGQEVQEHLGGLSERMTDLLAGYQVIRTFNLGDWILSRFEQANDRVLGSSLRRVRIEAALEAANGFGGMFFFIPLLVGGYLVMIGQTTFGALIGVIQLNNQIGYFAYTIGGTISRIQAALAAADRILTLLDAAPEPEQYAPAQLAAGQPSPEGPAPAMLSFQSVTFGYDEQQNILNELSFAVQPGQMVAFAGPSGGGKSTIFKLLLGCYPLKHGAIHVSGRHLHDYRVSDLRELFAYVPQDSYLFSGTVMDNIRYGKPDASEAEIITAAQAAYAHDFISEFPEGYQTLVGQRGARLSGGQRQRIAIARALLKDAPILLLDEATSALDSSSEQVVQKALEVLMQGRTTLVIAHRFSTIQQADLIYVIDGGTVKEHGRHAALLEQKGIYAHLFELQFKAENAPDEPALFAGSALAA